MTVRFANLLDEELDACAKSADLLRQVLIQRGHYGTSRSLVATIRDEIAEILGLEPEELAKKIVEKSSVREERHEEAE